MNRALLVGINSYPRFPLQGCVNDVNDVATLLAGEYGFLPSAVTLLTDAAATHSNIESALRTLIADSTPGDRVVFHYSGHGTQMVSDGEVVDAICPIDCDFTSSDNLTAPKFADLFSTLSPGVQFTWIADSCYAGGLEALSRSTGRKRYMPPSPQEQARIDGILASARPRRRRFAESVAANVLLVAGCGANEGADDADIDGRYNGAFTFYWLGALKSHPGDPLGALCEEIATGLKGANYAQTPQLHGSAEMAAKAFLA